MARWVMTPLQDKADQAWLLIGRVLVVIGLRNAKPRTDAKGHAPDDDTHLKPDDLAATIYHAMGIDPLTEYYTLAGRPVLLVPEGKVMADPFAL